MQRWMVAFLLFSLALIGAILIGAYTGRITLPTQWDPFAPYDVRAPAGPLSQLQYWRTVHDPQLCRAALARTDLQYQQVPDTTASDGCTLQNVVRVSGGTLKFNHSFLASCPLALAMARFESGDLQAAAQANFGENVREIKHVGSFACRAIRTENGNGQRTPNGALSEHAHANAIDLSGFVLTNGREITIGKDWQGNSANARFLHAVHADACDAFNTTLGLDYNALHQAHFHVDMGRYRICR